MNEQFDKKPDSVYSKRLKAGKRRTYFFDVRATRGYDYFLTITESRKRQTDDGYDRHKIFLYKEDFHKFMKGLNEAITYVKTELMPDFDFDSFNHEQQETEESEVAVAHKPEIAASLLNSTPFSNPVLVESAIAKQDIIDGQKKDGLQHDGHDGHAVLESKTASKPSFTEEVDKW
jgi:hypothetical protein